jgi:hypothetical protein
MAFALPSGSNSSTTVPSHFPVDVSVACAGTYTVSSCSLPQFYPIHFPQWSNTSPCLGIRSLRTYRPPASPIALCCLCPRIPKLLHRRRRRVSIIILRRRVKGPMIERQKGCERQQRSIAAAFHSSRLANSHSLLYPNFACFFVFLIKSPVSSSSSLHSL